MKVDIPALFMVGERGPALSLPGTGGIIDAMPALVPRLDESVVVPGGGHWLAQEQPDLVNGLIARFARRWS